MMPINEMILHYINQGLSRQLASARVCQDIILYAIANSPLNRNVTIKGGVVMRSLSNNNRRATRDIDLDFIHYSLSDIAITEFIRKLNLVDGYNIEIEGNIEPLKHQDYKGKCIRVKITDLKGSSVSSKLDIGVHKHIDIEQDAYCFDVCMCDEGVSLLKTLLNKLLQKS